MNKIKLKYSSSDYMMNVMKTYITENQIGIWHLGQNSFILRAMNCPTIAIDPYLTDSCGSDKTGIRTEKSRFLPVMIEPEDFNVELILLTHSHKDHTDLYTLKRLHNLKEVKFICPFQVKPLLESIGVPSRHINVIHPKEEVIFGNIKITGTFALPTDSTDLNHVGFLLEYPNEKRYYNTGDTAYTDLLSYLKTFKIDLMSICINGGYNNLSHYQAAKITKMINPQRVNPSHHDVMPHNYQPPEVFEYSLKTMGIGHSYVKLEYFKPFIF